MHSSHAENAEVNWHWNATIFVEVKSSAAGPRLLRWYSLWFDHVYLKITAASIYTGDWGSGAEALLLIFFAKKIHPKKKFSHFQGACKDTQILHVFGTPTTKPKFTGPTRMWKYLYSVKVWKHFELLVPPRILTDDSPTALSFELCHFAVKCSSC